MHYVYYLFDAATAELLYIGRSNNPENRRKAFVRRTGVDVVFGTHQRFSNFEQACVAELEAIQTHRPPYNKHLVSVSGFLGRTHDAKARERSATFCQHMSDVQKGRRLTVEHRAKISRAGKGRPKSPETRARMVLAWKKRKGELV